MAGNRRLRGEPRDRRRSGRFDDGHYALTRRALGPVVEAIENLRSANDRAADHLYTAWRHLAGRDPIPDQAYSQALLAVEAAAKPVVSPTDEKATLGKWSATSVPSPTSGVLSWATRPTFSVSSTRCGRRIAGMARMTARLRWEWHRRRPTRPCILQSHSCAGSLEARSRASSHHRPIRSSAVDMINKARRDIPVTWIGDSAGQGAVNGPLHEPAKTSPCVGLPPRI